VDRCALFVDAGYVLADGAMAVHGTRQRGSVSWDYAGLVKLLTGLSRDRTGLPVLRCYWYEATVEGRRHPEHDTLADVPGLKLRLGRIRPGRREGVETEMHRDLVTLARNRAVSDAVIVSTDEDLADVVTEVQELGLRVAIVVIALDGSWAFSRPLRQECDDVIEVSPAHLRPFVDLIVGAEPADRDEPYSNGSYSRPSLANGHGIGLGAVTHQGLPAAALPAAPTIYTAPVVEEYQRTAQAGGSGPMGHRSLPPAALSVPVAPAPPAAQAPPAPVPRAPVEPPAPPPSAGPSPQVAASGQADRPAPADSPQQAGLLPQNGPAVVLSGNQAGSRSGHGLAPGDPQRADAERGAPRPQEAPGGGRQGSHASSSPMDQAPPMAQASMPVPPQPQGPPGLPVPQSPGAGEAPFGHHHGQYRPAEQLVPRPTLPGREGTGREALGRDGSGRERLSRDGAALPGAEAGRSAGPAAARFADSSVPSVAASPGPSAPLAGQPLAGQPLAGQPLAGQPLAGQPLAGQPLAGQPMAGQPMAGQPMPGQPMPGQPMPGQQVPGQSLAGHPAQPGPMPGQPMPAQQYQSAPPGQFGGGGAGPMPSHQQFPGPGPGQPQVPPGSPYSSPHHDQGPYSGPQPAAHTPVPQAMTVSLSEAVQAAHAEGFGFGDAVARDAPALWLEAVLARKPRMPSDLEARLLQGSALPIDSLLHDEVRHSLRRGFWDALERSRR
jgi:hypothetical protein